MKNFLFDLYGTLLDIRTDESSEKFWNTIAARLGSGAAEAEDAYRDLCRRAEETLAEGGEIDLIPVFGELLRRFGRTESAEAFAAFFRRTSMIRCLPFAGVDGLLRDLKGKGARLYLCSNAQACFTNAEIDGAGLRPFFDGVLLSSEAGFKKPSPAFFRAVFSRFGLDPSDCVYIGNDLRDDVEGARGVGMRSVYIPTERSGRYQGLLADMVASNHAELRDLLLGLIR